MIKVFLKNWRRKRSVIIFLSSFILLMDLWKQFQLSHKVMMSSGQQQEVAQFHGEGISSRIIERSNKIYVSEANAANFNSSESGTYRYPMNSKSSSESGVIAGQKILLYITTHMPEMHTWFLKTCWPKAMENSFILNSTDVAVYLNTEEDKRIEAMELLQNTFSGQNLVIHVRDKDKNEADVDKLKQNGAMASLSDASREGWFSGYDWVFRVNPDVIIRNETFMLDVLHNDPNATGMLVDCHKFRRRRNAGLPIKVQTDFFAIKPGVIPKGTFKETYGMDNAEELFTKQINETILNIGGHRWVPNTHPLDTFCRVGGGSRRPWTETHALHTHPKTENVTQCPIPF